MTEDRTLRRAFTAGMAAISPVLLGMVPFGLVAGVGAIDSGMGPLAGVGASLLVFAGAAQLAAIELIAQSAGVAVIVFTVVVINARFLMYSAALAPHFREVPLAGRLGLAHLITDQAFAVAITEFGERRDPRPVRIAFYLGAALPMWVVWQTCTVVGILAGNAVPGSWSLDFAVPIIFLALLANALKDRGTVAAALGAAVIAVAAGGLPLNLGLPLAVLLGIACGLAAERGGAA